MKPGVIRKRPWHDARCGSCGSAGHGGGHSPETRLASLGTSGLRSLVSLGILRCTPCGSLAFLYPGEFSTSDHGLDTQHPFGIRVRNSPATSAFHEASCSFTKAGIGARVHAMLVEQGKCYRICPLSPAPMCWCQIAPTPPTPSSVLMSTQRPAGQERWRVFLTGPIIAR
jgi:hypothetical protein